MDSIADLPDANRVINHVIRKQHVIVDSVMIPVRDGSLVSATIVRPKGGHGSGPVVLKFGIDPSETEVPETRFIADTRGKRLSPSEVDWRQLRQCSGVVMSRGRDKNTFAVDVGMFEGDGVLQKGCGIGRSQFG